MAAAAMMSGPEPRPAPPIRPLNRGSVACGSHDRNAPPRQTLTGLIRGIRVEAMEPGLMQEIRYLDKLADEQAKGKKMEKVLRGA